MLKFRHYLANAEKEQQNQYSVYFIIIIVPLMCMYREHNLEHNVHFHIFKSFLASEGNSVQAEE